MMLDYSDVITKLCNRFITRQRNKSCDKLTYCTPSYLTFRQSGITNTESTEGDFTVRFGKQRTKRKWRNVYFFLSEKKEKEMTDL